MSEAVNPETIYAEARDAITGDPTSKTPSDASLKLKQQSRVRHMWSTYPEITDGAGALVAGLTADEIADFHKGVGCLVAVEFLKSPAGRKFFGQSMVKIGPVTRMLAPGDMQGTVDGILDMAAQAFSRIKLIALSQGCTNLYARSGPSVDHGRPHTLLDQMFGGSTRYPIDDEGGIINFGGSDGDDGGDGFE